MSLSRAQSLGPCFGPVIVAPSAGPSTPIGTIDCSAPDVWRANVYWLIQDTVTGEIAESWDVILVRGGAGVFISPLAPLVQNPGDYAPGVAVIVFGYTPIGPILELNVLAPLAAVPNPINVLVWLHLWGRQTK